MSVGMSAQILLSEPAKLINLKNAGADKGYATGGANSKNTCLGRTANLGGNLKIFLGWPH